MHMMTNEAEKAFIILSNSFPPGQPLFSGYCRYPPVPNKLGRRADS